MLRIFAILVLACASTAAAAEQNLLFILDASGSMWGRIEARPKISVAKEVMSGLVAELPEDARAGLMAYGHRRKGDCSDIESLVGLGPLDRDAMLERIRGLNPKGKTPISAATKQAIEELRQRETSASVVLVSDGLESCGGDPCAAVRAAQASGVAFRMHVVGFALGETDESQLRCMAEAGGGAYYTAANAKELTAALEAAVQTQPALVLGVTRNGAPAPARVFVYKAGTEDEVERDTVGGPRGRDDNPLRIRLPAGTYDVQVVAKAIDSHPERTLTAVEVPSDGEIARSVDFSDGELQVHVTANGEPLEARTYVQYQASGEEAAREGTGADGLAAYRLPPGAYRIKVRPDGIDAPDRMIEDVTVAAGETTSKRVDYASGRVVLTVTANGKPLDARTYIQHADTGQEAARDGTNTEGVASYRVPVGKYRIKVRPDGIDAPDRMIEGVTVRAGETTSKRVDYASGRMVLTVTVNGEPLDARTYIQHADTGREAARDGTNAEGVASYQVPVGEYRIKVRPDGIDAPDRMIEGVTVEAGEITRRQLDIAAGTVQVTVLHEGEPLDARTYLLRADSGREAARDGTNAEGVASYRVPVGKYRIKVRPDGIDAADRMIVGVTVEAGETTRAAIDFAEKQQE